MINKFNVNKTKQLDKINTILSLFYQKPICQEDMLLNDIREIIVVDFALIGDMIMNIPFFKTVRRNCPNAKVTMVCMPWAETILGDQGLVDEFVVFDGKNILSSPISVLKNLKKVHQTLKQINRKNYDMGFEPKGDLRHTLFLHYIKCKRSITYNYTGGDYLVTDSFAPLEKTQHLIDEKIDLLQMIGFDICDDDILPELILPDMWKTYNDDFLAKNNIKDKKIIGLHPGASNINKQYRYYPQLVEKINQKVDTKTIFMIFEGPNEKEIVDKVCCKLQKDRYIRVSKKLKEYISLVAICDYMICNDSAAGHIATAYGIPTAVIFGPIQAETALPRGRASIVGISHDLDCKPCTLPICPLNSEKCIREITLEEVYEAIKKLGIIKEEL